MPIAPRSLDHVALWVTDREPLSEFLCTHLGMHEIDKTDRFTLVGADARRGKLTLFAAEGPREPGLLSRVVLRVADVEAALAKLPQAVDVRRGADGVATFDAPEGLRLGLVEGNGSLDYDIDHVVLRVPRPEQTAAQLETMGFEREDARLVVADKHVRLENGDSGAHADDGDRAGGPLLNHIALLVDSAAELQSEAERRGLEIADVVDAANTLAVFVWGPDRIKLEYVEHKASFALV
jgi:catechol 2,3-dioxygenase-like lactoylglutathione lyase family enzyme